MDTTVDSKAEQVEAPEQIWLRLRPYGYSPYWYEKLSNSEDVQYGRVDRAPNTRQRAERAADRLNEHGLFTQGTSLIRVADIIAAEFDNHQ